MAADLRRPHRTAVALLLTLAALAALVGVVAVWINRQALDTNRWTRTSERLIADPGIRRALGGYAVDELLRGSGIDARVRGVAGQGAVNGLDDVAGRAAASILDSGPGRAAWRTANREAQRQLLTALDDDHDNAPITLGLQPLLQDLLDALHANPVVRALPGAADTLRTVPAQAGRLVVLRSDQVRRARTFVNAVRDLSVVLPLAALALIALAVALARGWRARALRRAGVALAGVGALVLIARPLLRPAVANALVSAASDRGAGRAAWMIGTSELRIAAEVTLLCGLVLFGLGAAGALLRGGRR